MRIKDVNPLFWVALVFLFISYFLAARDGPVPQDVQTYYLVAGGILVALMFLVMEKKLLTIREAQAIAYYDAVSTELEGRLEETGRLMITEEGVTRRVGDKPREINVSIRVEGTKPRVIVYAIHPYTGYIMRVNKRREWSSIEDPDLKIIVPPTPEEYLMLRKRLGIDSGVANAPV